MKHYLDYATTSAVRPQVVIDAVTAFMTDIGCTPGRGGHSGTTEAARIAFRCRRALAEIMGLPGDPGRIAFMQNATHAINTALWGLLGEGDALVISQYDHNATLRPADRLARTRGVDVRMLSGNPEGSVDMREAARLLDGARVLVVNAASNVLGCRMPLKELAALAHDAGALVVVDAAQSSGHFSESLAEQGSDVVAFTGHKGLLGPQGTGGLWVREGVEVDPMICGGTGGNSLDRGMPVDMPDHLEAGTGNSPGIAGLLAGCEYLKSQGMASIYAHEMSLKARLRDGLSQVPGIRILSPEAPDGVGIVTVACDDPATLSLRLDQDHCVLTRSGLHCAPEVHAFLGTQETGALRFSLGWASTEADVDAALAGTEAIVRATTVAVG